MAENENIREDAASQTEEAAEEAAAAEETVEIVDEKPAENAPEAEIEKLKKTLEDEKEKYLRLDAEYYNYRTRSLKEKQDAYDNALIKAVTEILAVIDNFERALAAECTDANFKKGVEMIFNQYMSILEKLGVKEIEALGKTFDPNLHNAVSQTQDDELGENVISAVFQKGYIMGTKVIRHSMVAVANP